MPEIKAVDLADIEEFTLLSAAGGEKKASSVYCCDLLSMAMGKAPQGAAWITVMSNQNTVAVAHLAEVACVILAAGVPVAEDTLNKARQNDICIIGSSLPVYESAIAAGKLIYG